MPTDGSTVVNMAQQQVKPIPGINYDPQVLESFVKGEVANILGWIKNNPGSNLVVESAAGGGKSTLLQLVAGLEPVRTLVLVMNAATRRELIARLPIWCEVHTYHSYCTAYATGPDGRKKYRLDLKSFSTWWDKNRCKLKYSDKQIVDSLQSMAKVTLSSIDSVVITYGISCTDEHIKLARAYMAVDNSSRGDFDDILQTAATSGSFGRYDRILLDEAQDVSPAAWAMIQRIPCTQLVAVGDSSQAINGFAGAMPDAMSHIQQATDAHLMGLSVSHRCSRAICAYVPQFQTGPTTIQPSRTALPGTIRDADILDFDCMVAGDPTLLIVARTKRAVARAAFYLYRRGIPFQFPECPVKSVAGIPWKLTKDLSIPEALAALETYRDTLAAIGELSDFESVAYELVSHCIESATFGSAIYDALNAMTLGDTGPRVMTCHKAKGLEAQNTIVLDWESFSPRESDTPWERKQARNLQTVACTRSRDGLYFIDSQQFSKKVPATLDMAISV